MGLRLWPGEGWERGKELVTQEVPGAGREERSPAGATMHGTRGLQHHRCVIHLHHSRQDARGHRGPASLAEDTEAHYTDCLACQGRKEGQAGEPPPSGRTHTLTKPSRRSSPNFQTLSAFLVSAQMPVASMRSFPRPLQKEVRTSTELPALYLLHRFSSALIPLLDWVVTF